MKRLPLLFIKWITNKLGFKIVMLKAKSGNTIIEGDKELLRYVDITGFFFKKDPLKREYPKQHQPSLVKPLSPEQLKELGIYINVDVADCKNYKEASIVQDLIINKKVKINILQNKKIEKKSGK